MSSLLEAPVTTGDAMARTPRKEVPYRIVGIMERETGPFGGGVAVSGLMIPVGRAKEIAAATRAVTPALVPDRDDRIYNAISAKVGVAARHSRSEAARTIVHLVMALHSCVVR